MNNSLLGRERLIKKIFENCPEKIREITSCYNTIGKINYLKGIAYNLSIRSI